MPREIRMLRDMPVSPTPPGDVEAIVLAADGAGDFRISSSQLRKVVAEDGIPVHVVPFIWSHGYKRIVADQTDTVNIRIQGQRMAEMALEYHAQNPQVRMVLYGHSSGCNVVLAALENLPSGVVDRAILLSAAMSTCYDVRPALKAVNKGIFVYHSKHDCFYLGFAMRLTAPLNRQCGVAVGRVGFRICLCSPEDMALYAKLYQRAWTPCDRVYGNMGGHYGNYQPNFIRAQIMPIIRGGDASFPPVVVPEVAILPK